MSAAPSDIETWSTDDVPAGHRVDYFASAASSAVRPFRFSVPDPVSFRASIEAVEADGVSVMRHTGGAYAVHSGRREIDRQQERHFNLLSSRTGRWRLAHHGEICGEPGIAMFADSQVELDLETLEAYDIVNLKLPAAWVREWIPAPELLLGKALTSRCAWGSALSSYLALLTPAAIVASPLPRKVVTDQVGALLSLISNELAAGSGNPIRRDTVLVERIHDCIRQRCTEPELCVADVAAALGVSTRTLHRALASAGLAFRPLLIGARSAVAARMLDSPLFARLNVAEIGRRAGFADPSHFNRAFRRHCGRTPLVYRVGR